MYVDSLNAWVGHLPADVEADIEEIAPMIKVLGYSTSKDPYYGRPDWEVTEKYNKWVATQDSDAVKNAPPEITEGKIRPTLYSSYYLARSITKPMGHVCYIQYIPLYTINCRDKNFAVRKKLLRGRTKG